MKRLLRFGHYCELVVSGPVRKRGFHMMGYGDMAGYAWIWMTLGLAFTGVVIAFSVHAFGRATTGVREGAPTPDEILRQRFARGEIDAAEYEARRRVIRG